MRMPFSGMKYRARSQNVSVTYPRSPGSAFRWSISALRRARSTEPSASM